MFKHLAMSRTGRFETVSVSDGVPRLSVYSQISDLPIVVAVGQATADIYAQWRRYAWTVGALIAALTAMTGALAWFLLRELNWHRDAQQQLATLASTDGLTGLSNRWHFDDTIRREWRRARRDHTPVALLMIDADEFKTYNDGNGHQAGDRLLRTIGEAIASTIQRGADLGARYGGDEFAVLLPGTTLEGAARVADQIRQRFNADCLEQGTTDGAKISIGAACLIPGARRQPHDFADRRRRSALSRQGCRTQPDRARRDGVPGFAAAIAGAARRAEPGADQGGVVQASVYLSLTCTHKLRHVA